MRVALSKSPRAAQSRMQQARRVKVRYRRSHGHLRLGRRYVLQGRRGRFCQARRRWGGRWKVVAFAIVRDMVSL